LKRITRPWNKHDESEIFSLGKRHIHTSGKILPVENSQRQILMMRPLNLNMLYFVESLRNMSPIISGTAGKVQQFRIGGIQRWADRQTKHKTDSFIMDGAGGIAR
jgi:hypothetical protein